MDERKVKLTGLPVSEEMQSILERLSKKEYVSMAEINATQEIRTARSNVDYSRPSIQLDNRQDIQAAILRKMNNFGYAVIDETGKTEYTGTVDKKSRLDIVIGLPGSGKSSAIVDTISQEFHSKLIDNDEAKKLIPQYNNGWGAAVVHEESQLISDFAFDFAVARNENIVLPKVGSDSSKLVETYIQPAKENGYKVYIHFVDVAREVALGRMMNRFIEEGRFLDPELIDKYVNERDGNKIEQVYDVFKHNENLVDGYSKWDNDVARGERPFLIESEGLEGNFIRNARVKENNNERNGETITGTGYLRRSGGDELSSQSSDEERQRKDNRRHDTGRSGEDNGTILQIDSYQGNNQHEPDPAAEPTVTILWSEHNRFHGGETMSLSEANALMESLDKAVIQSEGYYKTKFRINFVMNGQPGQYEGRQDLGDGDGTLIDHIEKYHAYYANNENWDNHLLHKDGAEALKADKAQRDMLLNEFVPYMKMHCNLSAMEKTAQTALNENSSMTPAETAYHTAIIEYVSKCRDMVNQGDYDLPSAPQLADFDAELKEYREHVKEEIAQEAAAAGMTVEEYAANGYEPYAPDQIDPSISVADIESDKELSAEERETVQVDNTFSIYQLKDDVPTDYPFRSLEELQKKGLAVDSANYDKVYDAALTQDMSLERIFEKFNFDRPEDFKGHSLSVSDVVMFHQNGTDTAHYVDSIGFVDITKDFQKENPLKAEQSIEQDMEQKIEEQEAGVTYYTINEGAARRAKEMNSYGDYVTGSATAEYRQMVDKAAEIAKRQKERVDPSFHEKIDGLLDAYARKLAENMNNSFSIEARVPSILITGGGNFPVRKKEKQNAARDRNMEEWKDIQGLLDKIRSTGMGGISADDPQAVQKLEIRLEKLEKAQEVMKAVNAYYRKEMTLDGCPHISPESVEKLKAEMASQWHREDKPYPSWALSNNNAEIHRIKGRIEELTRKNETHYVGWEFAGGRVEANTQDNRLQIFFNEKPNVDIRTELKGNGFRWAPSVGAWQRQLNDNAIYASNRIKSIQPITGERPTELQKRARQKPEERPSVLNKLQDAKQTAASQNVAEHTNDVKQHKHENAIQ